MLMFLFPGQGSQKKGMGEDLFDSVPEYGFMEKQVDEILGYSLRDLCLTDRKRQLSNTQYTQPALYIINALCFYQAMAKGYRPDIMAGHSLGEYNALLAAGAFDFLTGLSIVKKRGELMSKSTNGAMSAVLGLDADKVQEVIRQSGFMGIDVANFNSPTQVIISGAKEEVFAVDDVMIKAGANRCIPLPVSAAFHSRFMNDASKEFDTFLQDFEFRPLNKQVIANVTAKPYPSPKSNENFSKIIRSLLVQQMSQSVQWVNTIKYALSVGVDEFEELGPGTVLSGLNAQILSRVEQDKIFYMETDYAN